MWESIVVGFKMLFSKKGGSDKGYIHIVTPELEVKADFKDEESMRKPDVVGLSDKEVEKLVGIAQQYPDKSMSYAKLKRNADYFFIGQRVSGSSAAVFDNQYFVSNSNKYFTGGDTGSSNSVPLSSSGNMYLNFMRMDESRAARKGTVTFYLDTSVENSPKFYYSFSGVTNTESTSSQSFTVYFDDFDSQWGSVMCCAFAYKYDGSTSIDQSSSNVFGNWAGSSMEYQATGEYAGLYKATFNLNVSNKAYRKSSRKFFMR